MKRENVKVAKATKRPERVSRPKTKPVVTVVPIGDGKLRIVNAAAGAAWAGVTRQAFSAVVRRYLAPKPPKPRTVWNRKKERVFAAFPELFEGVVHGDKQ